MKSREKRFCGLKNFYWKFFDSGIVKMQVGDKTKKVFRLFGKTIPNNYLTSNNIMYFKINRESDYALSCIQEWINIAYEMNYDFIFV